MTYAGDDQRPHEVVPLWNNTVINAVVTNIGGGRHHHMQDDVPEVCLAAVRAGRR